MKKRDLIFTALYALSPTFLGAPPPPPPPPPSGYQSVNIAPTEPKMLVPPQLEDPHALQQATPHPSPSATPGAMASMMQDEQVPMGDKIRAMGGPAAGLSLSGKTYKIKPGGNYKVPQAVQAITNGSMVSFTQNHRKPVTTNQLFENQELAQAYKNFVDAVHEVPTFIPMFRKLHIIALHQIYMHLVGIYVTLNMTSITDIKSYLALEKRFGLNKKTLIINQLVKIIQSQLTQAILSLLPGLPLSYTIKCGMATLARDTLSNPDALVLDLETSVLTAIGASPVSNNDAIALYSALTSPQAKELIERNKDINVGALQEGLKYVYQGAGFVQPLTKNPAAAQAVVAAINTLLGEQVQGKLNANYQNLTRAIESGSMQGVTEQQMQMLEKIIQKMIMGIPLQQEIAASQELARMISANSTEPLSAQATATLAGVMGFILKNYETQTSQMLTGIIKKLEELNPSMAMLSPMQKLQAQQIVMKIDPPAGQTPLALDALNQNERQVLARAFMQFGTSTSTLFSRVEKQILMGVGQELEKGPISFNDLQPMQSTALKKALMILSTYKFQPVSKEEMLSEFSEEEMEELTRLCQAISAPGFKGFQEFPKEGQVLLLRMYQGLIAVVQTRLYEHEQVSQTLQTIFANNPVLQNQLFKSITSNQYLTLNNVDKAMEEARGRFSLNMLSSQAPPVQPGDTPDNPPLSAREAVEQLFSFNPKNKVKPSYLTLLYTLQKQNNANPTLQNIMGRMPIQEQTQYQEIARALTQKNFSFSMLNLGQKRMLVRDLQEMQQAGVSPETEIQGQNTLLAGTPAARLQTMATLIENTMNFSRTKTSFLWVLKQYLLFFNAYCATLQNYESNGYVGLTEFENYARNITEKLAGTKMEQLNPPIFFYNKETLDGIRMLPQLATLVEGTEIVPYPTFPMILALKGSTIDPLDGKTYTNQVNFGNFSFNKFFFIDTEQQQSEPPVGADPQAFQPAPELTGQAAEKIRWIKEVPIPASTKTTSYTVENQQGAQEEVKVKSYNFAFFPENVPSGISGFYANIPLFTQNPVNKRQSLIRLYEQPIYAQPPWLNFPGFSTKEPDALPGVVTVLRGCLGDFTSLLRLNIFDPCLSVIFASALALENKETSFEELQSNKVIQEAMSKCSVYLKAKQEEIRRMSQVHTVNASSTSSAQQSVGGVGPLPTQYRPTLSGLSNVPSGPSTASAGGGVAL